MKVLTTISFVVLVGSLIIIIFEWLTKGKRARQWWALTAFGVALILPMLTFVEKVAERREQDLADRRALERFERIGITFEVSVSADASGIWPYRDRLESAGESCLQEAASQDGEIPIYNPECRPRAAEEPVANAVLSAVVLYLDFFKEPAADCSESTGSPADRTVLIPVAIRDGTLKLAYNRRQGLFLLRGELERPYLESKSPKGAITAPMDLAGTKMVASLRGGGIHEDDKEVYRSIKLRYLDLNLLGARSYERRLDDELQRIRSEYGYPTYAYCFGRNEGS